MSRITVIMKRIYEELIQRHFSQFRQMVFLMGPRQVGKTTLSLDAAKNWPKHFYYNWDNPSERLLFIEGPSAIATQIGLEELTEEIPITIFDEIHKYGKWKNCFEEKKPIIVPAKTFLSQLA